MSDIEASAKALHMKPEYFRKWRIELAMQCYSRLVHLAIDPGLSITPTTAMIAADAIIVEGLK